MALLVAAADEDKDYLEFFMPFVADRLKAWPRGHAVEPHGLSQALRQAWGFPSVPSAVSRVLLQRAQRNKLVTNVDGRYFPDHEQLVAVRDLTEKRQEMLAGLNALTEAVVAYAWDVHGLVWSEEQARSALERLIEEFGEELATAKREGGLGAGPSAEANQALAVVYGFARRAIERDPTNFDRLVAMVQGAMIANVLYFDDMRKLPNRLPGLRVYIDTAPLLRGLGLACPEVVLAAREMLALMRSFKIPMFVFTHTIDEITVILERTAQALQRGTRVAGGQGQAGQGQVFERSREAMDAAIQAGMSSGEVLSLIANLEPRLEELGVRRCETPRHLEADHIDEARLEAMLGEYVRYTNELALRRDLQSLAAVERLRGATRPRELASTRALFVTANEKLARASRAFFRAAARDAPIPQCMTDVALTAQLWVSSSERRPDLPRRLLIADCYSALAPSPPLWERWVGHLIKLRQREQITEAQLLTLIYSQQIKALLFEVARDDPENVDDDAVAEVLARYEAEVRESADRDARTARAAAARERAELLQRIARLQREHQERQEEGAQAAHKRARRRRLARRIAGFSALPPIVGAFVACASEGAIQGRVWWASSVTLLVFACASAACWALERGWKAPLAVLISVGALSTFWANVFGIAGTTQPAPGVSNGPKVQATPSRDVGSGRRGVSGRHAAGAGS